MVKLKKKVSNCLPKGFCTYICFTLMVKIRHVTALLNKMFSVTTDMFTMTQVLKNSFFVDIK